MREERFVGTEEIDALWSALDARLTGLVCRAWTCTDVAMRERHTHERDPSSGIIVMRTGPTIRALAQRRSL